MTNVVSQYINDLTKRMVSVETNILTLNTETTKIINFIKEAFQNISSLNEENQRQLNNSLNEMQSENNEVNDSFAISINTFKGKINQQIQQLLDFKAKIQQEVVQIRQDIKSINMNISLLN